jgi:ribosome-associated protein
VMSLVVSVTGVPPWIEVSGVFSFCWVMSGAQSADDSGYTSAIGVSAGSVTFTRVIGLRSVLVTWNVRSAPLVCGAVGGLTVTSARAGPATASAPAVATTVRTPARRARMRCLTTGSSARAAEWFNGFNFIFAEFGMMVAMREVAIGGDMIRLGQFLKLADLIDTGGEAKVLIASGDVTVNGQIDVRRGRQLAPGDVVAVQGREARVAR